MLVVLWLAFPSKDLAARLASAPRSDLLTIAYLKAWLAAKPDDWPIYLSLARHNLLLGRYDSALVALRRIRAPQGSTLDNDAAQMRLLVLERQAYALPEGSPERRALLAQVALELAKGKSAIEVGSMQELVDALQSVRAAAEAGELDGHIEIASASLGVAFKRKTTKAGARAG